LAVDDDGNVYVGTTNVPGPYADWGVRKYSPSGNELSAWPERRIVINGIPDNFNQISDIHVGTDGTLYIVDAKSRNAYADFRKWPVLNHTTNGEFIKNASPEYLSDGVIGSAQTGDGRLLLLGWGCSIHFIGRDQDVWEFRSGGTGCASQAIALGPDDRIYVLNGSDILHGGDVIVFDSTAATAGSESPEPLFRFPELSGVPSPFVHPRDIAVDRLGNIFVLNYDPYESENTRVFRFGPDGSHLGYIGLLNEDGSSQLNNPNSIAVDSAGRIYVLDDAVRNSVYVYEGYGSPQ